jgi:RNA polymerase sigma-70 factor (ECF subfamily)
MARRVLANQHGGGRRRERLGARLRERLSAAVVADPSAEVSQRVAVRAALARLGELDREVLRLTAWEGLEPREAVPARRRRSPFRVCSSTSRGGGR